MRAIILLLCALALTACDDRLFISTPPAQSTPAQPTHVTKAPTGPVS